MVFGYAALVILLRISGSRTLAKMNAFDLVVTVALGSTLATVALSRDVSLTEGLLAFSVLCGAQYVVARASIRWPLFERAVKTEPQMVLRDGTLLLAALRRTRLTPGEIRQAVRASGAGAIEDIAAVVLENDGTMSVIRVDAAGSRSALRDVEGRPPSARSATGASTIRVLVVGDSVTVLAEDDLGAQMSWADELDIRATSGARTDELLDGARAGAEAEPDVGIFFPGYNDILQDHTDEDSLEAMMELAAGLPVSYWLLIPESIAPGPERVRPWNRRVEALARGHDNVMLVREWQKIVDEAPKSTYLMDLDGVHPNRKGRHALAVAMTQAAQSWRV